MIPMRLYQFPDLRKPTPAEKLAAELLVPMVERSCWLAVYPGRPVRDAWRVMMAKTRVEWQR